MALITAQVALVLRRAAWLWREVLAKFRRPPSGDERVKRLPPRRAVYRDGGDGPDLAVSALTLVIRGRVGDVASFMERGSASDIRTESHWRTAKAALARRVQRAAPPTA